jgi:hypothetical protein
MITVTATVCNVWRTNWYLWCNVTITNLGLSKCDHGLWEPTCCRTEIPSGSSQTTPNEIIVRARFQFKFPARCLDSSDIREGLTKNKTTEFEWSCGCHRQPTTSSIFATWCAAWRLNTPCPWVSRQRSYLSSPNNGCFGNAMIPASVRTLHEAYVQEMHHRPLAMVAVTSKLKPKRPKRR